MSLGADLTDGDIKEGVDEVKGNSPTNWVLLGYVPKSTNKLRVVGKGSGGISEAKELLSEGKVQYVFLKQTLNGMRKYIYIAWCGEGVTGMLKGSFNNHAQSVGNEAFKGYHVQINARNEKDIKENDLVKRVEKAAGAFLHQKQVADQSTTSTPQASSITYEKRNDNQSTESKPQASRVTYDKRNENQSTENKPSASSITYDKRNENQSTESAPQESVLPKYQQQSGRPAPTGRVAASQPSSTSAAPTASRPPPRAAEPEPEPEPEIANEPEPSYAEPEPESQAAEPAPEASYMQSEDSETPAEGGASAFAIGAVVSAQYSGDGQWYEATVVEVQDGQYQVNYGEAFNNETEWLPEASVRAQ